jgi:DNA-binding NtrC family response regulator
LRTLKEAESEAIRAALSQFVEVELAAIYLGCSRSALYIKMHKLGISVQNLDTEPAQIEKTACNHAANGL